MSYYSIACVVDGALDTDDDVETWKEVQMTINNAAIAAALDGMETKIWVLFHDHGHELDEDCVCSQYLTDHAPYCTFNQTEAPA